MPLTRTATTEGAAKGMITVRAPHELQENEVAWLQDCLVNQAGLIVRRNGLPAAGTFRKTITTDAALTRAPCYVTSGYDPSGTYRILVLWNNGTSVYGSVYDSSFNFISRQFICRNSCNHAPDAIRVATLSDGGLMIWVGGHTANLYTPKGMEGSEYSIWYGAAPSIEYGSSGTTTATVTINRDSVTVTASVADTAKMVSGTIIQNVGIVKKVETTTTVTLTAPYFGPNLAGVVRNLSATMFPWPEYSTGLVNTAIAGNLINGYGTDWKDIFDSGRLFNYACTMYSRQDGTTIATFQTNGTMGATSGLAFNAVFQNTALQPFAVVVDGQAATGSGKYGWSSSSVGIDNPQGDLRFGAMVATYKGYTHWASMPTWSGAPSASNVQHNSETSKVIVSGPTTPFEADFGPTGNWYNVPGANDGDGDILAIEACRNGVVIGKRRSVWLVSGDNPANYQIDKIHDDGIFGCTGIIPYKQGVIWVNKSGIWYFDGSAEPKNLIEDSIQNLWVNTVVTYDPESTNNSSIDTTISRNMLRMFIYRDHLFISMGGVTSGTGINQYGMFNGKTKAAAVTMTLVMYLPTGACNFWTNFDFLGFLPPQPGNPSGYVLVSDANGGPYYLLNMDAIMDPLGSGAPVINDNFQTSRHPVAVTSTPCFYMETPRYDLGDAMNRKVWKGFAMEANFTNAGQTSRMLIDYVIGLNATGTTLATWFPDTLGLFKAQRVKARARDQFLGFRIYEDTTNKPLQVTIAPWQMIYKPGRPGAI